jgi:hypothetical protein
MAGDDRPAQIVLSGLGREVLGFIRRHPVAAVLPAFILGAGADLIEVARHHLGAEIALGLLLAVVFELYVGWAELIVAADRHEESSPVVATLLRRATVVTPPLVLASLVAVSLPLAAAGLLVIPGLWLMTRWSLFAPAIVHERLGVRRSLARSSELVRGAFWPVAVSVTLSVLIEHAAIHATAHGTDPVLGSQWLALLATAVIVAIVSPPAAFAISLVYERLEAAAARRPPEGEVAGAQSVAAGPQPRILRFSFANSSSVRIPSSRSFASSRS